MQPDTQAQEAPNLQANQQSDPLRMLRENREMIILGAILILAAVLRFTGVNWDSGAHLHPDERFVTLVAVEINWPGSFSNYLDVTTSTLSPYNTENYKSYVYGTFPLFLTKAVADFRGMGEYGELNLVGRQLSALFDLGNLVLVYLVGNRLFRRNRPLDAPDLTTNQREFRQLGLYSAGLYALTVFSIQQSHFFTVDNFESFFIFLSFFFLVRFSHQSSPIEMVRNIFFASIAVGFAIASKLSALLFLPIIAVALGFKLLRDLKSASFWRNALLFEALGILSLATAYVTVRIFNPYMFATNSWTDIGFNESFEAALTQQRSAIDGEFMFPPQWQWVETTAYWFPLRNYLIWGLGLPMGLLVVAGIAKYVIGLRPSAQPSELHNSDEDRSDGVTSRDRFWWATPATLAILWIAGVFFYRAGNFVKTMRYFLYLVPFVVIFATYALSELRRYREKLFLPVAALVMGLTFIWAVGFTNIYRNDTTRVAASNWIFENIPSEAVLANEHWDDGLPVWFDSEDIVYYNDRIELEVYGFDQVNEDKVRRLYDKLARTDYIFVSSTRAAGSIGTLPESHPFAVSYYDNLADGSLGFELAETFASYPSFLGIDINDESAEEAFWVYDHPTVRIYRKAVDLSYEEFYATINDDAQVALAQASE